MFALLECVTTKMDTNCATDCNYSYFSNRFNVLNIHTRHGNEEYVIATTEGVVYSGNSFVKCVLQLCCLSMNSLTGVVVSSVPNRRAL